MVKNIIVHIGTNYTAKQQSEILKRGFTDLLDTLSSFNTGVFISGPIPPVSTSQVERFSRLLVLNTCLSNACSLHSVHMEGTFLKILTFSGTADIFLEQMEFASTSQE